MGATGGTVVALAVVGAACAPAVAGGVGGVAPAACADSGRAANARATATLVVTSRRVGVIETVLT
jgi:hypothetical protein